MQIEVSVRVKCFPALLPLRCRGKQLACRLYGADFGAPADFAFSPSKFFLWLLLETNKKVVKTVRSSRR
jgi:hypothetical protein